MTPLTLRTKSADDTRDMGAAIAALLQPGDLVLLAGDLGAGKTTLTQGVCSALGVPDQVTSPTFTLLHEYRGTSLRVLHADVYRLERLHEVIDLGIPELIDEGGVALVEWGDVAEPGLPPDHLEVRLAYPSGDDSVDDEREVAIRGVGPSWAVRFDVLRAATEPWAIR